MDNTRDESHVLKTWCFANTTTNNNRKASHGRFVPEQVVTPNIECNLPHWIVHAGIISLRHQDMTTSTSSPATVSPSDGRDSGQCHNRHRGKNYPVVKKGRSCRPTPCLIKTNISKRQNVKKLLQIAIAYGINVGPQIGMSPISVWGLPDLEY